MGRVNVAGKSKKVGSMEDTIADMLRKNKVTEFLFALSEELDYIADGFEDAGDASTGAEYRAVMRVVDRAEDEARRYDL